MGRNQTLASCPLCGCIDIQRNARWMKSTTPHQFGGRVFCSGCGASTRLIPLGITDKIEGDNWSVVWMARKWEFITETLWNRRTPPMSQSNTPTALELVPCPICGQLNTVEEAVIPTRFRGLGGFCHCLACGFQTRLLALGADDEDEAWRSGKWKAIRALWNMRPPRQERQSGNTPHAARSSRFTNL